MRLAACAAILVPALALAQYAPVSRAPASEAVDFAGFTLGCTFEEAKAVIFNDYHETLAEPGDQGSHTGVWTYMSTQRQRDEALARRRQPDEKSYSVLPMSQTHTNEVWITCTGNARLPQASRTSLKFRDGRLYEAAVVFPLLVIDPEYIEKVMQLDATEAQRRALDNSYANDRFLKDMVDSLEDKYGHFVSRTPSVSLGMTTSGRIVSEKLILSIDLASAADDLLLAPRGATGVRISATIRSEDPHAPKALQGSF